ncbi:MAG: aldolase/citrate lyase family protein [Anaerolineales bacterium]|nr:aldolase/citrate lyase family protein [Anaerolineales bacterium]
MFGPIQEFRERLSRGETLIGAAVAASDPIVTDALSDSVDFLWYDQEHSPMSYEALRSHLVIARAKQRPTVVRVTQGSTPFVKPVLDSGASGVIAPQVRTVDEVKRFVDDCRYPNTGSRGAGPMVPSNYYRTDFHEHEKDANENVFAAVMIETSDAVDNIDDIVAIPGLDSIVIGPMDLSGSLGVLGDTENPKVVASMEKVISAARSSGVYVGAGLGLDPEFALTLARRGVQWLQMAGDIVAMIHGMDSAIIEARRKIG